ncbi:MAG TPA: histone deacetylase [Candidatus Binataceae bacterium]|nr:histone deacetylase [Candidatus Binataceae bacterium]
MHKTLLVADRRYMKHIAGRVHPERPERIVAMIDMAEGLKRSRLALSSPREASLDELTLCHRADYVATVERSANAERTDFDPDTRACAETWETAKLAAGGVLTAAEAVLDGEADNAFAIVRPPGHHALPDRAMGFCFFNNVAVTASWLVKVRGLRRVLILDWDVHHGNGTQNIFYESPEVMYMSMHQFPFYPGTGWFDEIGSGAGAGFTVNAPLTATFSDDEYLRVCDELFLPIARQFRPDFVLISSGFDCHYRDPLGGMRVTENGFVAMTRRMSRLADECCGGRMAVALEGGYDVKSLADCGRAVIDELGRDADEPLGRARNGGRAEPILQRANHFLKDYWSFD